MKRRRTLKQEYTETDRWTKFYRSGMAAAVAIIMAGGGWYMNGLSDSIKALSDGMVDLKIRVGQITYIQQEQSKKFDSLERKVEGLRK